MDTSTPLGIFYIPTALLPLRRKACWGFFRPKKSWRLRPGLNPRTWVPKARYPKTTEAAHFAEAVMTYSLLASTESLGNLRWQIPWTFHLLFQLDATPIFEIHRNSENANTCSRSSMSALLLQAQRVLEHVVIFVVCVFRFHLITTEPGCKPCLFHA